LDQILTITGACRVVPWVIALALSLDAAPARSQSNLDARRSPEEIFSDTCSACHHSARELKQPSAQFLLKHYTTGARQAAAMAAYLERAIHEPPPAPVASPTPARRPSESVEMQMPADGAAETSPSRAAAAIRNADERFEE
jgi:mono/diheme cytochrome c family protein